MLHSRKEGKVETSQEAARREDETNTIDIS
jgi:hypothetical protein